MIRQTLSAALAATTLAFAVPAIAQADPPRAIVSIYHVAPGQQANFLKWLARQDAIAAAAGQKAGQLYVHTDGDNWDYITISPVTTEAEDKAFEEAGKKMGVNTMKGGLEMRKMMASHTDTFTIGPITAGDYLKMVGE